MTEHSQRSRPLNRRRFLSVAAASAAVVGGLPATTAAADESYVLEQDGNCVPITPLRSGDETAEEFYDYRAPFTDPSGPTYSSYGTTDLQRDDTSILFLYEDSDGELSLVFVHGKLDGSGDGGSVTFELAGLTESGEWAILDDDYEGPTSYDAFDQSADSPDRWTANWTWNASRSDGGVYTGLGDDFEVTIQPAFNQGALLFGQYYDGAVSDWQVVSGSVEDPEYTSLNLDEPVTIRRGGCGDGGGGDARQKERKKDDKKEEPEDDEKERKDDEKEREKDDDEKERKDDKKEREDDDKKERKDDEKEREEREKRREERKEERKERREERKEEREERKERREERKEEREEEREERKEERKERKEERKGKGKGRGKGRDDDDDDDDDD